MNNFGVSDWVFDLWDKAVLPEGVAFYNIQGTGTAIFYFFELF